MKKAIASIILGLSLAFGSAQAYEKNDNKVDKATIDHIVDSSVLIQSRIKALCMGKYEQGKTIEGMGVGSGVILYDKDNKKTYVLTNNHVAYEVGKEVAPECRVFYIKTTAKNRVLKVVKRDRESDLALLEVSGGYEDHFKGKISDKAEIGDYVLNYGFPAIVHPEGVMAHGRYGEARGKSAHIYLDINGGNSGSGIYAFDKGDIYLVGLVKAHYVDGKSITVAVSGDAITKFLMGTELENDYITQTKDIKLSKKATKTDS